MPGTLTHTVGEDEAARTAGLDYLALPIEDRSVPEPAAFRPLHRELTQRLHAGQHIVAHCRHGIGRSSLLAAALLVTTGYTLDEAWAAITAARGRPVPDTEEQRRWVSRLEESVS